jgi:DNA-binding NarL/FixJ family response regulator
VRVAVVRGAGHQSLDRLLGNRFVVRRIADAALYDVLDTVSPNAAAVVVVDLGTVPNYTLSELHALLPEVQIVGLTATRTKAAYYRRAGVNVLLPRTASAAEVARAVKSLVR